MLRKMTDEKPFAADRVQLEKEAAASAALRFVRTGMVIGLGSGTTAGCFARKLSERVQSGELQIRAVASSLALAKRAEEWGIPLMEPRRGLKLDLAVDGADEISPDLVLIKGAGGALLREKVIADAARNFLIVADASKCVATLGRRALPVEVVPFACPWVIDHLQEIGANPLLRMDKQRPGEPFVTNQQNQIVDCHFGTIADPASLATRLKRIPGVVEHGLFLGYATAALVANGGTVSVLRAENPPIPLAEFHLPE